MPESNRELTKIITYMKAHWPSAVKPEWQVSLEEYPVILQKVLADFTSSATQNHRLIRIAGVSGSGKTTQILPAVEAYCSKHQYQPILVAARRFVEYHPHYQDIKDYYGAENLRKMTDEFATILMFLTLSTLLKTGYDIILDVTLLDPEIEAILLKFVKSEEYNMLVLMIAVSPTVTEHFLKDRAWRHSKETEREFISATAKALAFYATKSPDTHIILWSVYDEPPIYDGPVKDCLAVLDNYSSREDLPKKDDDARREAKIKYLTTDLD